MLLLLSFYYIFCLKVSRDGRGKTHLSWLHVSDVWTGEVMPTRPYTLTLSCGRLGRGRNANNHAKTNDLKTHCAVGRQRQLHNNHMSATKNKVGHTTTKVACRWAGAKNCPQTTARPTNRPTKPTFNSRPNKNEVRQRIALRVSIEIKKRENINIFFSKTDCRIVVKYGDSVSLILT